MPSPRVTFQLSPYFFENLPFQGTFGFCCIFPCDVGFGEVAVVFVVEDSVEDMVCAPWCSGADELAGCCSLGEEDCIVHFFVVGCEVHFVPVDEM